MSWLRFGDEWVDDPAVLELGDLEARGVLTYLRCLSYIGRHLTDGNVPPAFVRREDAEAIDGLARVALVERHPDGSIYLPRWGEHLKTRVEVEQIRADRAAAGSIGGSKTRANRRANGKANGQQTDHPVPNPGTRTPVALSRPVPFSRGARENKRPIDVI